MIRHRHHRCYNYLNLPSEVIKDALNKVMYIYDATGSKLCRRSTTGGTTTSRYYTGLMEYNGTTLDIIHNEEGLTYYTLVSGLPVYEYEYYLKDHLGNIRNTFTISNNTAVSSQYTEYYPFGMVSVSSTSGSSHNDYLYNGKELQRDLGMEWYDYGARFYDPQIGRWNVTDNKEENYFPISPYVYALNNPALVVDIGGNDVFIYYVGPQRKGLNYPVYYFFGHTAVGARPTGSTRTWYHPTSGNIAIMETLDVAEPYFGYSKVIDEGSTILNYARSGEVVIRMRLKLPDKVEEYVAIHAAGAVNGRNLGGFYCTKQVRNILIQAYLDAGYSLDEAKQEVKKILWYGSPEYPTGDELIEAGFYGFDLFYKDENSGEVRELNVRFGDESDEDSEENNNKSKGLNNLLKNFSSLESGTYTWNGTAWVKQ